MWFLTFPSTCSSPGISMYLIFTVYHSKWTSYHVTQLYFSYTFCRCYGLSPSTWSLWLSSLNSSWSPRRAKLKVSPATTCSLWDHTVDCTSSTGSTVSTSKDSSISLLWLPALYKLSSTAISSISMSLKVRKHSIYIELIRFSFSRDELIW